VIIVFVAEVSSHSVVAEIDWPSRLGILLNACRRNFIMHVSSRAALLDEYQSSTPDPSHSRSGTIVEQKTTTRSIASYSHLSRSPIQPYLILQ
jgi:hypothetical protein